MSWLRTIRGRSRTEEVRNENVTREELGVQIKSGRKDQEKETSVVV